MTSSSASSSTSAKSQDASATVPVQRPAKANILSVSPEVASYFVAGGCAGAASRTVVSPLERLKIIQQVQPRGSDTQYKGVYRSLVRMWKEEGFKGFMRGNGINCLRIVPYSAVQFTTYEQLKKWFTKHGSKELDTPKRLASGALAGITSVCSTYPLDLVRSRLSIATASISLTAGAAAPKVVLASIPSSIPADLTIWGMTLKIMREEGGVRGLYRGLITTAVGVAPYVGINFAAYEFLRGIVTPPGKSSVWRKLSCGALAGACPSLLGAIDALRGIVRAEGVPGLYRGLWPICVLKVAPSIATSFFVYELVKEFLIPQ
ncbi:mitochondrial carrier domain-containing protein [Pholiota molesta]|nr:mitochondrial carrier domain-containing protein [Pholiota molesta]